MKMETIEILKNALRAEHEARANAFKANMEFLDGLLKDLEVPPANVLPLVVPSVPRCSEMVRTAISEIDRPFGIDNVAQKLKERYGKKDSHPLRAIIRNEIAKLRYAKKIEVLEPGKGNRSGVYRYSKTA